MNARALLMTWYFAELGSTALHLDGINWSMKRALEGVFSLGETVDLFTARPKGIYIFL